MAKALEQEKILIVRLIKRRFVLRFQKNNRTYEVYPEYCGFFNDKYDNEQFNIYILMIEVMNRNSRNNVWLEIDDDKNTFNVIRDRKR